MWPKRLSRLGKKAGLCQLCSASTECSAHFLLLLPIRSFPWSYFTIFIIKKESALFIAAFWLYNCSWATSSCYLGPKGRNRVTLSIAGPVPEDRVLLLSMASFFIHLLQVINGACLDMTLVHFQKSARSVFSNSSIDELVCKLILTTV